jgi:hypothetical protein
MAQLEEEGAGNLPCGTGRGGLEWKRDDYSTGAIGPRTKSFSEPASILDFSTME